MHVSIAWDEKRKFVEATRIVQGKPLTLGGTNIAAPFVTGAIALLRSAFPDASEAEIKFAVIHANALRRTTIVPPLLDAWAAYQAVAKTYSR